MNDVAKNYSFNWMTKCIGLLAKYWFLSALLLATDALCVEVGSINIDTKQDETNVAVFFDGNPEFSSIQLDYFNNFLELKILGASVDRETPINFAGISELIKGAEVIQRGRTAVVRIETEGNAEFIKKAAKIGRYQDQLMVTLNHTAILKMQDEARNSPIFASKERLFDMGFYALLVAILCIVIVFKSRQPKSSPLMSRSSSKLKMQTLATIPASKTHQLSMVEIGNQKLLIANGPSGVQLLTAFPLHNPPMTDVGMDSPEKVRLINQLREQIKLRNLEKDAWGKKS